MMISSRRRDRERTKFTGASYLGSRLSCYEVKQLVCNWRDKTEDLVCVHFLCCYCCYVASVVSDSVRLHSRQPTRLARPWDSPGKNTGVGCHFLLQCTKVKVKSLGRVRLFATPWTAAYQAPLSMGFSRQEYWSALPLPSPIRSD